MKTLFRSLLVLVLLGAVLLIVVFAIHSLHGEGSPAQPDLMSTATQPGVAASRDTPYPSIDRELLIITRPGLPYPPPKAYPYPLASQVMPSRSGSSANTSPIPQATDTRHANPGNVPPMPSSTPFTPNAYPHYPLGTFTPYPTPTLRPGPSPTPIPFILPARDASGTLIYFVKQGNSARIETLALDANGVAKAAAVRLPNETLQGDVYYSPDGSRLVEVVDAMGSTWILEAFTGKREETFLYHIPERFFNWFPDNRHVLVRGSDSSLRLADPFGSEYIPLFVPDYNAVDDAAASPDGYKVIYSYQHELGKPSQVWMVNSDGRDAKLLFETGGVPYHFTWSPDGTKVAFYGDGLTVMNADGSNLRQVGNRVGNNQIPCEWGYPLPPAWSPDSRTLAMSCLGNHPDAWEDAWTEKVFKGSNIYLVDVDSGEQRPILPDGSAGNLDPTWSPDGKQIAFVSNRSGTTEVWAVNADGSHLRQMTHTGLFVRFPFWRRP
jgi:dipeptidyl aminopeptidase/acylaminoacyl peptidase